MSASAIMRQPFEYLTELQCHSAAFLAPPDEAGRLRFISSNLAGCILVRIVEEEVIAVEIIDHQKPIAPRTLRDRNALGLASSADAPNLRCGCCAPLWSKTTAHRRP